MASALSSNQSRRSRDATAADRAQVQWLPAAYETVQVARRIHRGLNEVETLLHIGPDQLIALAYGKHSETSGLIVNLSGVGPIKIPVRVESLTPSPDHHDSAISLRWQAIRATRYFPIMEGDLKARPGEDGTTLLILEGRYRPPLGLFGLVFDRIIGRRVASATAACFVDRVADEIERDVGKEPADVQKTDEPDQVG